MLLIPGLQFIATQKLDCGDITGSSKTKRNVTNTMFVF